MYLPTLNHNARVNVFSEVNFEYFSENGILRHSTFEVKLTKIVQILEI